MFNQNLLICILLPLHNLIYRPTRVTHKSNYRNDTSTKVILIIHYYRSLKSNVCTKINYNVFVQYSTIYNTRNIHFLWPSTLNSPFSYKNYFHINLWYATNSIFSLQNYATYMHNIIIMETFFKLHNILLQYVFNI